MSARDVMFSHNAGLAYRATAVSVNEFTTFNPCSVRKTFTSAVVLQLVERGHIDLDCPITRYLDPPLHRSAASVRRTLLHTAGFANTIPLAAVHLAEEHAVFDQARFVEDTIYAQSQPIWKPGAR